MALPTDAHEALTMNECKADCYRDSCHTQCIRFVDAPGLVWPYFQVAGKNFQLESRQFKNCECGCGRLIANPPANVRLHPSLKEQNDVERLC